jgi:uncharacterized protein YeaO (DUF488 family)
MSIRLKRAYDKPEEDDGYRVLVDRLWPRGLSKADLKLDSWLKQIAPSDELRKWFGHDAHKWDEFKRRYWAELESEPEALQELARRAVAGRVTLVYAASDRAHNNAVALQEYLARQGNVECSPP